MPLLGFTVMRDKIESGAKRQTIRLPRKRPIKVGDTLYLYWKPRTKESQRIGVTRCRAERRLPWWFIRDDARLTTAEGEARMTLAKIDMTLLSGHVLNQKAHGKSVFLRYLARTNHEIKGKYRLAMLPWFMNLPEPLKILTFPFTNWLFEGMLLHQRHGSGGWRFGRGRPVGSHTAIVGIERDEAAFRAGLNYMPCVALGFRMKDSPPYASASLRSYAVKRYLRCSFENLASSVVAIDNATFKFNAAWLDFNGPITLDRKLAIECFLKHHAEFPFRLGLTFLNGHYDRTSSLFWGRRKIQGIQMWLVNLGAELLYGEIYSKSMIQLVADIPNMERIREVASGL